MERKKKSPILSNALDTSFIGRKKHSKHIYKLYNMLDCARLSVIILKGLVPINPRWKTSYVSREILCEELELFEKGEAIWKDLTKCPKGIEIENGIHTINLGISFNNESFAIRIGKDDDAKEILNEFIRGMPILIEQMLHTFRIIGPHETAYLFRVPIGRLYEDAEKKFPIDTTMYMPAPFSLHPSGSLYITDNAIKVGNMELGNIVTINEDSMLKARGRERFYIPTTRDYHVTTHLLEKYGNKKEPREYYDNVLGLIHTLHIVSLNKDVSDDVIKQFTRFADSFNYNERKTETFISPPLRFIRSWDWIDRTKEPPTKIIDRVKLGIIKANFELWSNEQGQPSSYSVHKFSNEILKCRDVGHIKKNGQNYYHKIEQ